MKQISKRDEQIYQLKNDGHIFVQIGELFDITKARAQKIYTEVKYLKEEFPKLPPLERALSTRSKNALLGYFKDKTIFTNPEILVTTGREKLLSIQNIGAKNIKEITEALYQLGYIDYDDPWLDNYRDKRIAMFYISPERQTIYDINAKRTGKWRITEMNLWDQDYIDMENEGYFSFQKDNIGNFQFGLVRGELDYRLEKSGSKKRFEFSWVGMDEG